MFLLSVSQFKKIMREIVKFALVFLCLLFLAQKLTLSALANDFLHIDASQDTLSEFTTKHHISGVLFEGLEYTSEEWLKEYIDVRFPSSLSLEDLEHIRRRLLTTRVFHKVTLEFVVVKGKRYLFIRVSEMWTTIPVVRAEFGGGTPLYVAGIYDQHSFGRLLTLGGEFRRYGNEAPGFVVWAKSPRLKAGKYSTGVEYWREIRKRTFYDLNGEKEALFTDKGRKVRGYYLMPSDLLNSVVGTDTNKVGFDLLYRQRESATLDLEPNITPEELIVPDAGNSAKASVVLVADNIEIEHYDMDGYRNIFELGASFESGSVHRFSRIESFFYHLDWPFNYALHFEYKDSQNTSIADIEFLGGFGSVRGYPDGIRRGSKLYYVNMEMRQIALKYNHFHWQLNTFVDVGNAGISYGSLRTEPLKSYGFGVRIASPHVDRLMLRLDYGKSFDGKHSGFTVGLSQFFQPYKPL